ncbi:DUF3558 domain-containing protein [Amycolatopsis roodepoortensis]|uniref:DUF3558 domain-containing protein n=1 Tax=Amycolatopsis roodepoortensis TaxID=700274 RepID=UPI00214BB71B|nr:DUF3558 domain-containing protein [Amycolatopsis roodepoortensis]UUV35650.1 DUF3558 domain-containing protein [Amycolatopsis roodepoortensis]
MRRATLILTAAAVAALSACSTPPVDGSATPTSGGPSSAPPSSAGLPPDVPKVEHPIDVARFKQDPCATLTKPRVDELLGPRAEAKRTDGASGPSCRWSIPSTTQPRVHVIVSDFGDSGTAKFYAAKGTTYKLLEPLEPIDNYPVTAYGDKDNRAEGQCSVALGTSDTQTVSVNLVQSEAKVGTEDPCKVAREAAIRVLATIRGGN